MSITEGEIKGYVLEILIKDNKPQILLSQDEEGKKVLEYVRKMVLQFIKKT